MNNSWAQEWLGNWAKKECDVHDRQGNHCPDEPVHYFEYKGKQVGLCERCYKNYQNGAFDESAQRKLGWYRLYIAQHAKCRH